jgi:uncharacterized membrane protein
MGANPWLVAIHVGSLIVWLGTLLVISRMAVHALRSDDAPRQTLTLHAKRLYHRTSTPAGALAIITGLLMIHGVFTQMGPGDALGYYFKPLDAERNPTSWYATFHVKMVSVVMLLSADIYLGRQVGQMARGHEARTGIGLCVIAFFIGMMCVLLPVWLIAGELGLSGSRTIGFGVGIPAGLGMGYLAWRLGKSGKGFVLLHGLIAAIAALIVVVILARPLAGGVPV